MFALTFTGGATPDSQATNDAEVDHLITSADVVVKGRYRVHRCGVTPLEPVAPWRPGMTQTEWSRGSPRSGLTLTGSLCPTFLTFRPKSFASSRRATRAAPSALRLHSTANRFLSATWRASCGRPVRWLETREEHLMSVSQERDQIHDLEIGATKEGRIVALRDRGLADNGDGCEGVYWGYLMPFLGAHCCPMLTIFQNATSRSASLAPTKRCFRRHVHLAPIRHVSPWSGRSIGSRTV